jgi:hypothetical protein
MIGPFVDPSSNDEIDNYRVNAKNRLALTAVRFAIMGISKMGLADPAKAAVGGPEGFACGGHVAVWQT